MVFSTNQNRQLYVASSFTTDTPSSVGEIAVKTTPDNKQIYLTHYGEGGITRSDLIDVDKISYVKYTAAEKLRYYLKTATVSLNSDINDGAPVSGQDYILRIYIRNYLAIGDSNVAIKYGAVHAYSGMTAAKFYEVLADSLTKNFSRELTTFFTFEATDDGVVITEVEQPWILGTYQQEAVNFELIAVPIEYDGDEVNWATVGDDGKIEITSSDTYVMNGKKIADLEYFCHGERGDQYRNVGFPRVIPTKYMVDPDDEYDVLDIHYSFKDTGVNDYKSEKDITIVSNLGDVISSITSVLEGLDVTVETDSTSSSSTTESAASEEAEAEE